MLNEKRRKMTAFSVKIQYSPCKISLLHFYAHLPHQVAGVKAAADAFLEGIVE